jgi:hypothetical protein
MSDEAIGAIAVGTPERAGATREGHRPELIIVVDDPQTADSLVAAYTAADAPVQPHYHVAHDGTVRQFVADDRAGRGLGLAIYKGRWRNIDRIALSVRLELPAGGDYTDGQLQVLQRVLTGLMERHTLDETALSVISPDAAGRLRVHPYLPPPPPLESEGGLLGAAPLNDEQRLFVFLMGETWGKRTGEPLKLNQAFPLQAAKFNLGAPLAPNKGSQITAEGLALNFQVCTRDTIFNVGTDYAGVQSMLQLMSGESDEIPLKGVGRALLEASYAASIKVTESRIGPLKHTKTLRPDWRFHLVAKNAPYGPPLSDNYVVTAAGKQYAFQVFAGETLYTPMTDQANCFYLSRTDPADPAYHDLWRETYKYAGAPYDQNSAHHQHAVAWQVGMPLTGVYSADFEGTRYAIQVFGFDTLYAGPDGQIKRMSELAKPPEVVGWQPKPPRPVPPTPPNPLPPVVSTPDVGPPRPGDINWPPRPNFNILTDTNGAREKALGRITWVHSNGDNIRITNNWAAEHIVDVVIPQLANIRGGAGGRLKFHRVAAEPLRRLWAAWEAAGLLKFVLTFDGAWVPRTIRRKPTVLSNHAYGTAFDINAQWNGLLKIAALVGQQGSVRELVPLANAHGFYWGGHWNYDGKGGSDGMHFEWAVPR